MKTLIAIIVQHFRTPSGKRDLKILFRYFLALAAVVALYSAVFHFLMAREGQEFSWVTGFYWTFTVMSTLGFGDITFQSDIGRIFSILVLLSGTVFLLVLLPFIFIEFFYEPWMASHQKARVPRTVPPDVTGHVILTQFGTTGRALIEKLKKYQYPYVLLTPRIDEAIKLMDEGVRVAVGDYHDPNTYKRLRIDDAALVFTSCTDVINSSVAFTARGMNSNVPIVATARDAASFDILELAGCSRVLSLSRLTGEALARRTCGGSDVAHVIGELDELLIAEANAIETPFVGQTIREQKIREMSGVTIVGLWERGHFDIARPETEIRDTTVLVLAGSREQLARFNEACGDGKQDVKSAPVIIIGGGRVGRTTAQALTERGLDWRIVEPLADRVRDPAKYIVGSAADLKTLKKAGIENTPAVIITTRDDDTTVYLTIYCRMLRPDVEIISRTSQEHSVPTLHRAGCEFAISYASMGANAVFNLLRRTDLLMVAEGLDVFKMEVPVELEGKTIRETTLRQRTGCTIMAIDRNSSTLINPSPDEVLEAGAQIVLIGTVESETRFLELYATGTRAMKAKK